MSITWFSVKHDMPSDKKLAFIAEKSNAKRCEVTAFWVCLLDHASQNMQRGFVGDIDLEIIAYSQQIDHATLATLHRCMCDRGMIIDGYIAKWEEHQGGGKAPSSTERSRLRREKIRKDATDATAATLQATDAPNATPYTTLHLLTDDDKNARAHEIFSWCEKFLNSPTPLVQSPIYAWLDWGAELELDIKPVAERWRKKYPKKTINSLSWLNDGVAAAIKQRAEPMPEVATKTFRKTQEESKKSNVVTL